MNPIDIAARVEIHDQLMAAVKGLAEPYRSAVWLRYVEGHEASEIARQLGASVETVRTQVKRGVAKLREDLDRRHGGRRADWVPSLAAFAGVKPTIALMATATTTASGAASLLKLVAAASIVLVVVGAAVVGGVKLFRTEKPEPTRHPRVAAATPGDEAAIPREEARARSREGQSIHPKPSPADPAETSAETRAEERTFSFHYQQGFSFDSESVTNDVASADLVFKSCAGGISSVTLEAPGGVIVGLGKFQKRFPRLKSAEALLQSIVRADAPTIGDTKTAEGDDREAASDVFVVKTRRGRWVALAIVARDPSSSYWMKIPVTIRYSSNLDGPVFGPGPGDVTIDGVEIDGQLLAKLAPEITDAYQARIDAFKRRLAELDARAAGLEPVIKAHDGADIRVGAVIDLAFADGVGLDDADSAARYSFTMARRGEDPEDFELATQISVRIGADDDDRSLIWDLGDASWETARLGKVTAPAGRPRVVPMQGAFYAIHRRSSGGDRWMLMRVEELVARESMIFSWVSITEPSFGEKLLAEDESAATDGVLESPEARLQIRGGAGGGNPFYVFLDRRAERIKALSARPLNLEKPLHINEDHRGFVTGGRVPAGMVFLIDSIEYSARVLGDGNGPGEFLMRVGPLPVAHVREDVSNPELRQFRWFSIERGEQLVGRDAMPVRARLSVSIPIAPGDEHDVWAEIKNSSWGDVTLKGRFVPAEQGPRTAGHMQSGNRTVEILERIAAAADDAAVSEVARTLDSEFAAALRTILEAVPPGSWRTRLTYALDHIPH